MGAVNKACQCPNIKCENHGHCKECRAQHNGKSAFCQVGSVQQNIRKLVCKVIVRK